jgi:putative phage-type endonuclease
MKLLDLVQGTPEWRAMRRIKIGASDCSGILSKNQYITPYRIWRQKIFGDEEVINEDMQRGILLEEAARKWVCREHGVEYRPVCVESEERPWQIASLDCFYRDTQTILAGEIKCPREKKFQKIVKSGIPEYWKWQVQHQLSVTRMEKMFFLLYTEEKQHLIWVQRDKSMIEQLNHLEEVFYYEHLLKFAPPGYTEEEENYLKFVSDL